MEVFDAILSLPNVSCGSRQRRHFHIAGYAKIIYSSNRPDFHRQWMLNVQAVTFIDIQKCRAAAVFWRITCKKRISCNTRQTCADEYKNHGNRLNIVRTPTNNNVSIIDTVRSFSDICFSNRTFSFLFPLSIITAKKTRKFYFNFSLTKSSMLLIEKKT